MAAHRRSSSAIPRSHLLAAAKQLLAGLQPRGLNDRGKANDLFEFWLWALTVDAARNTHGPHTIRFYNLNRGWIHLRTSPSHRTSGSYTYTVLWGSKGAVQLHTGIYVTGVSQAKHELDLVALEHPLRDSYDPDTSISDVQWAMEAKLYQPQTLSMSIPRAALGTAYDIGVLAGYRGSQKRRGPQPQRRFPNPLMMLAASAQLSRQGRTLLGPRGNRTRPVIATADAITSTAQTGDVLEFINAHVRRI